jgi:uncharacterized membrane protein
MLSPMRAVAFWIAAAGGLLLAITSIQGFSRIQATGAALFALGVLVFFVAAVVRSRAERMSLTMAVGQSAQEALRFAWYLVP